EDKLREAIAKLRDKSKLLEEEDKRKALFLAILGHELRNPLSALDNGLRVVQQGIRTGEELQPMMSAHVLQLKRLVDDLLDMPRITPGTVVLRKSLFDVGEVAHKAAESVANGVSARKQQLILPDPKCPLPIVADSGRLEQVLANLLANASKFTPVGGR